MRWYTISKIFSLMIWVSLVSSQNPFDIKSPANQNVPPKESRPAPKTDQVPPTQQKEVKPATSAVVPPTTTIINPNQVKSSDKSKNPFDIKAGTHILTNTPSSVIKSPATTTDPLSNPTSQLASPSPKIDSPQTSSSAATKINNPFNIVVPGPDQNLGKVISPTQQENDKSRFDEKINELKQASSLNPGAISKNIWFIIYVFLFLLAAIAINFNRSYPLALIKSTYNQNQLRILFKDAFKGNHLMIFGILYFIFIMNAGIFLYLCFKIFGLNPLSLFSAILIVFAVYLIRHLILWILGMVFPLSKEAGFFSYTIGIHNLALGLALMLVNILLSFVEIETGKMLIFSGLAIIVALYVMRQVRGLLNIMPMILSGKFHFIIYLCTVEIAPWVLLSGILLR